MSMSYHRCHNMILKARKESKKVFIPYIICGDPSLAVTKELVKELADLGADIIELGVPFSDPVADGVTNQLGSERALRQHVTLSDCCDVVRDLRQSQCQVPIVLFTYLNPILRMGIESFAKKASDAGVDAVLIVDMPIEEAGELTAILSSYRIGVVTLISPTTSVERMKFINKNSTDFIYVISRHGVTGEQDALSNHLQSYMQTIKKHITKPFVIGFGISSGEQAKAVAAYADGVVVGSALVKQFEQNNYLEGKKNLLALAAELRGAIT